MHQSQPGWPLMGQAFILPLMNGAVGLVERKGEFLGLQIILQTFRAWGVYENKKQVQLAQGKWSFKFLLRTKHAPV